MYLQDICSSSISYEMVHCNRHNLALLVPFSVSLPEPRDRPGEPHQAFLRNQPPSVQLRPAKAWTGCGWGAVSLYLTGVGGTQSTWPPLTWSLTAPLTEPEIASLPPTLREAGSGSCCVVLCWGGWNGDGTLHSSAYILSLPSVNHIMQGPMLDTAVGGSWGAESLASWPSPGLDEACPSGFPDTPHPH